MSEYTGFEIAITGMAGRFPGANTIDRFWENLRNGVESIEFFSREEILEEGEKAAAVDDPSYVRANAYVKDKEYFDANFFGYLPAEAQLMDPQARLFHEVCWVALEDAGCNPYTTAHKIGLFAGATPNVNWEVYATLANSAGMVNDYTEFLLSSVRFLTTKIAYAFNFKGVSMGVETACSTSLVAVHQACRSLLLGDCTMALAGGVTIRNESKRGYLYQEGMIHSADGHCRAFDAAASGTVGGEGAAVVVLKRLEDAIKEGDHIYAVIRGTGINNDGNDKAGYTAPSIEGQMEAIMMAHEWAKVDPATISYVEAHGTGTRLGDPVEMAGLTRAFNTDQKQFCAIGSVKSNIGHLDTAAGVAGLIKAVLSLHHRELVPSLHYKTANPEIDFTNSPFYVNTELREWPQNGHPLRAGVSSFGIGGTNVHVVLEEAPVQETGTASRRHQLLLLSGKTAGALERNAARLLRYLQQAPAAALADIAYTLQAGRESFNHRKALVCRSREEAIALLGTLSAGAAYTAEKRTIGVAFMFPGQGAQYANMCQELYEEETIFRNAVDQCFSIVSQRYQKDLGAVFFGSDHRIDQTEYTQPCLFIVEYALSQLLMHWGIRPAMMIGHSIGEYVAACISGIFSLEDALHLVVKRGEWMQSAPVGKMLSVSMPESSLVALLQGHKELSLAAVNGPSSCVVSGAAEAIAVLKISLEQQGHVCRELRTSHAFHSYMMDNVLEGFRGEFKGIVFNEMQLPFISNVTGREAKAADVCNADYWVRHLRAPVRFAEGLSSLLATAPGMVLLELGPGKVLSALAGMQGQEAIATVRGAKETGPDGYHLTAGLGQLWERGVSINWADYYGEERRLKVSLPGYSFEPVKFPVHVDAHKMLQEQLGNVKAVLPRSLSDWFYVPVWKQSFLTGSAGSRHSLAGGLTDRLNGHPDGLANNNILIFGDDEGARLSVGLASRLRTAGHQVTEVYRGPSFLHRSEGVYELHPQDTAGYALLASSLIAAGQEPFRIIHMWSLGGSENPDYADRCYSLSDIAKTWSSHCRELVFISEETQLLRGDEAADPFRIMGQGLLKVISQEYPDISTAHIDISLSGSSQETLISQLVKELAQLSRGAVVSYRQGQRWIEQYDPVQLDTVRDAFRANGVYLITGGLGNLGYTIAKYLLQQYNAQLILLGRTSQLEGDKQRRYEELHSLGRIRYIAGDIADTEALTAAIGSTEIHGVIHAAGVVEGRSIGLIRELGNEDYEAQFAAKINGLQSLAAVLKDRELDFCVATSSLSTVLGGLGFGAYAAANKYMDQFVKQGTRTGVLHNWLSISLDGLDFDNSSNEQEIDATELCEVLERAISYKELTHIVVSKTDLAERLQRWVTGSINKEEGEWSAAPEAVPATLAGVQEQLQGMWESFFGQSGIAASADFFETGGDSLKALTMLARIHKIFAVDVSIRDFYDHATIAAQSELIFSRLDTVTAGRVVTIPVAASAELYPLSSAQRRMYFLHAFDKQALTYNMPHVIRMEGIVDTAKISRCFEQLINRHEILRTSFELREGEVMQRVHAAGAAFEMTYYDAAEAGIAAVVDRFIRPFDLGQSPLLRAGLIRIDAQHHVLLVDMHHVVTDGVSTDILINDFTSFYKGATLPALRIQYKDYAQWQQSEAEQQRISAQKDFWLSQYSDLPEPLELPVDFMRPLMKSTAGAILKNTLSLEATAGLKALAEREKVSLFMVLLSIYHILLSKLSNQEDIVVGTPTAGRLHADLEGVMGMFVNTLPIRNHSTGTASFRSFLQQVKQNTLSCFDNQEFQYEDIVESLGLARDMSRNPLFDAMFSYENFEDVEADLQGVRLKAYDKKHEISKFDLTLIAGEDDGQLTINFEYSTALFRQHTIARIAAYFKRIVAAVIADAGIPLKDINILDEAEQQQLLHTFNDTAAAYPADKTIVDLFEEQVARTPAATALIFGDTTLSYTALHTLSAQLANYLHGEYAIGAGDLVGVILDRSMNLLPVLLGILKTGAAYVPVDPSYPESRVAVVLRDAQVKLVLDAERTDTILQAAAIYSSDTLPAKPVGNDLAYVIYTSGSTGQPKGVMIEHQSLVNRLWWMQTQYPIGEGDMILQKTPVVFDVSLWELFWWSFTGAGLYLLPPGGEKDPEVIKAAIASAGITTLHFVPSMLEVFLLSLKEGEITARLHPLKRVFCSGEALKVEQVKKFRELFSVQQTTHLINLYGPTEATVDVSWYNCEWSQPELPRSIPIGRPIANTALYVLDRYGVLSAPGVAGELYIGGTGVGRGYLNNDSLTKERFMRDPYREGGRMYRTGDLVRWLEDGNLEYIGRIDDQVKLRGLRIELGEIAWQLSTYEGIRQSTVVMKERAGNKYIVGYYISDELIATSALKSFLGSRLPEYMVPSYFVRVAAFPLTINGKLNRKALPDPEITTTVEYIAPSNDLQKQLVKIWGFVLGLDTATIGIHTNFFELGGHSMDVIKACNEINSCFNTDISVATFFEFPLISKMAKYLSGKTRTEERDDEQYMENELGQMQQALTALNRILK